MELELDIVDYIQVGITAKDCMKIIPYVDKNKKVSQKIVVGDQKGTLQCFGIKKNEVNTIFKTLPGSPINKIVLGGALGTAQDKVFVASNSEVRGYSKKGKKFLDFNTNLTESITNLHVNGSDLLAGGLYLYNHFSDCVDQGYYFSPDKINDLICVPSSRNQDEQLVVVLACNDSVLRLLIGCQVVKEIPVSNVPIKVIEFDDPSPSKSYINLVCGFEDGTISHINISSDTYEANSKWLLSNEDGRLGGVSCMCVYDLCGDGAGDLLVGREDGHVQLYSYHEMDEPLMRYKHCFNESITSICGGCVGSAHARQIVVSTYSGWITAMTTEQVKKSGNRQPSQRATSQNSELQTKVDVLKNEVETLQVKVEEQRKKYAQLLQQRGGDDVSMTSANCMEVKERFVLSPDDASYHLSIETPTPIEHIVLQSNVPIDVLDGDKTTAVVSHTKNVSKQDDNFLLATYRCQANTTRFDVRIRSIEGHQGAVRVYIVPRLNPKSCVMKVYPIKPLSLHQRIHELDEERPTSSLSLSGNFSLAEIHSFLHSTLPNVAERPPTEDKAVLMYQSVFLNTQLKCTYQKGEVEFQSDNISTISIVKEVMSREATRKKIALKIRYNLNDESVISALHLIHPKLNRQLELAKKMQLLSALQELQTSEGNTDFLASEYQDILKNCDEIKKDFEKQPAHLERLYGMLTDLYIDNFKFKGVNAKHKAPQLLQRLDNYSLDDLVHFFQQPVQ